MTTAFMLRLPRIPRVEARPSCSMSGRGGELRDRARAEGCASARVEALALVRHLDEHGSGRPALAVPVLVAANPAQDLGGAEGVDVTERAAAEGRKPEPEDRPDVGVTRAPQEPLAETEERLVHELERAAHLDLFRGQARLRIDAEDLVDRRIHLALAVLLRALVVAVEAAAVLAALPFVLYERFHRAG